VNWAYFMFLPVVFTVESTALGQGTITYIYDQQSATESTGGGSLGTIQTNQPLGQSFTPSLSEVGFIRLFTVDRTNNNGIGATLTVNLRSDSIVGPVLGSTAAVSLADGFGGYTDFLFATPVQVTPGITYYLQPIVQAGDSWAIIAYDYHYSGGTLFVNGTASPGFDLWFREGIIIPEPSSAWLAMVGASVLACGHLGNSGRNRRRGW
jgi:hypothetical protein